MTTMQLEELKGKVRKINTNKIKFFNISIRYNRDKMGTFSVITKDIDLLDKETSAIIYADLTDREVSGIKVEDIVETEIDFDCACFLEINGTKITTGMHSTKAIVELYKEMNLTKGDIITYQRSMSVYVVK